MATADFVSKVKNLSLETNREHASLQYEQRLRREIDNFVDLIKLASAQHYTNESHPAQPNHAK